MDTYYDDETNTTTYYCDHCGELLFVEDAHGKIVEQECEWEQVGDDYYCSEDAKSVHWNNWLEETLDQVEHLAERYDWDFDRNRYSGGFGTSSRYYTLHKECDACILGKIDEDCECRELKLRLSDHGSAYCSEDISLSMIDGGDDHTLETLEKVLKG